MRQEQGLRNSDERRRHARDVRKMCNAWPEHDFAVGDVSYATLEWADLLERKNKDFFQPLFAWSGVGFCRKDSVRSLAATLYLSRRNMPINSSSSQVAALEQAFDGIKQALDAAPADHEDGRAYFSKAARLDLA